ncbi:carbamoyltransferase HypF [Zavarzinia sp.]|uniref:carbamoyltransferase HypF n=1 Tax=Zavarzinia sp. TaxID=2027920 RepID=UPI0035664543
MGLRLTIAGLVQGVGFRPFVWRLARRFGVTGKVWNDGNRVLVEAFGPEEALARFAAALEAEPPPLARIETIEREDLAGDATEFRIVESEQGAVRVGIVADIATCPACLAEIRDPGARRYRYAFANCTDCGPRFSIVRGLPYDRSRTTMAAFPMCPACRAEYDDPADRRFHAQPIACAACGPRAWLEAMDGGVAPGDAVTAAADLLKAGGIVAVKGIGGFHLAVDAGDEAAVAELRRRKHRPAKPLALMVADLAMAREIAIVDDTAAAWLGHPSAPIVLLPDLGRVAPSVAPGQAVLGVMLASTPLHHLLLEAVGRPLVMTSGNRSSEPQIHEDAAARTGLAGIADALLMHDRAIARRLDDSVLRVVSGAPRVIRRGRGFAPVPLPGPADFAEAPPVLALGGELKTAICLSQGRNFLLSHHLGDLEEPATEDAFETALADYAALFAHRPTAIAIDGHGDYRSSRLGRALAQRDGLPLLTVQHHHAHIAAALAENQWPRAAGPVIGIALDGLGLGADGTLWGGEILLADYRGAERLARLRPTALPGGAAAMREPWRVLTAHLAAAFGAEAPALIERLGYGTGKPVTTILAMIEKGMNAPLASSTGRLFDAAACLLGLAPGAMSFEGEAAMALEAIAEDAEAYPDAFGTGADLDPTPLWRALLADRAAGVAAGTIAGRFHASVAEGFAGRAVAAAKARDIGAVALSGGVFQNARLLAETIARIEQAGLRPLAPSLVPANDGGLALGQAAVAAARLLDGR